MEIATATEAEKLLRQWFYVGQEITLSRGIERGRVTGFGQKYVPRGGLDHKRAGVYFDFYTLHITKSNGEKVVRGVETLSADDLRKNDDGEIWNLWNLSTTMQSLHVRIGDLPDTPFWIGDAVVSLRNKEFIVTNVDYAANGGNHGNELYALAYQCDKEFFGQQHGNGLRLVERGNIWKLEHGEPLSFLGETAEARLLEEAEFYKSLGMSQRFQHNGDTGVNEWSNQPGQHKHWPIGMGIEMLRDGKADQIKIANEKDLLVVLIKYDNVEFGNRMRANEIARRIGPKPEYVPHGVHMME